MKKIVKFILNKISRVIYLIYRCANLIIPRELKVKKPNSLQKKLSDNLVDETFNNFKVHFKKSLIFKDVFKIREYAINTSLLNDKDLKYYYLEFGVYSGLSTNYFSKHVKKLYAFDSFEGLREDWGGKNKPKGHFNLNKKIPKLNLNVETIVGRVEDTLEPFLQKHNPKINFIHLDMDTYSPTKFTLEKIKPYLTRDAILIFDELYNYNGWEYGEYKALKEVFSENEYQYKAFNLSSSQIVIQIK